MDGTIIGITIGCIIMVACSIAWDYNKLVKLNNKVKEAWDDLEVKLKSRDKLKSDHKKRKELLEAEDGVQSAALIYNTLAKDINAKMRSFPSNLFAKRLKLKHREYFESPTNPPEQTKDA